MCNTDCISKCAFDSSIKDSQSPVENYIGIIPEMPHSALWPQNGIIIKNQRPNL